MSSGASAGAIAAATMSMIQAVRAFGVVVTLEPAEFERLLLRCQEPLVVHGQGGLFRTNYQYLVSHKGLAFYTNSPTPLVLPQGAELIRAGKISIPG